MNQLFYTNDRPLNCIGQADWADEQASRTEEFQRELQAKTEAMSDLTAEKVRLVDGMTTKKVGNQIFELCLIRARYLLRISVSLDVLLRPLVA